MKEPFKKRDYKLRQDCSKLIKEHVDVVFRFSSPEEREKFSTSPWESIEEYKSYRLPFRDLYTKCMGQGNSDQWLIIFAGKDRLTKELNPELDREINAELD